MITQPFDQKSHDYMEQAIAFKCEEVAALTAAIKEAHRMLCMHMDTGECALIDAARATLNDALSK